MPMAAEREGYVQDLQRRLEIARASGDERKLRAILRRSVAGLSPPRSLEGQEIWKVADLPPKYPLTKTHDYLRNKKLSSYFDHDDNIDAFFPKEVDPSFPRRPSRISQIIL